MKVIIKVKGIWVKDVMYLTKGLLILLVSLATAHASCAKSSKNKRAVVVYDDSNGRMLHQEYAHELRHPASLTKKIALYVVFKALKAQKINFHTTFVVSKRAASQEPCNAGYKVGERVTVIELIKGVVTQSANDGAVVLAEGVAGSVEKFVKQMNETAKKLGMSKTIFYNPTGLPHPYQFTTAHDMLTLAKALRQDFPDYYQFFKTVHYSYNGRNFRNHNRMLGAVEGMDGIKTGFVNASGFNVSTSTVRNGRRVYVVFMGGASWRARDKEVVGFIEAAFRSPPCTESLAPTHQRELATEELNERPYTGGQSNGQLKSAKEDVTLVHYLNGIDAKDALQKTLETPSSRKRTGKMPQIVSLSSVKPLGEGKLVRAVLHKPVFERKGKKHKRYKRR